MTSPSPLVPGTYYHIYNRGTNRENVFFEERNYRYFLQLYARYIEPVAETYAYCLLKNHFHLLVRMKEIEDPKDIEKPLGSIAFSNLFNAYAKAVNKARGRVGSLFQHPFGRIPISAPPYLVQMVKYIHFNPQKHGFVSDFRDWLYSSYHSHLSTQSTRLCRDDVMGWFDNKEGFISSHQESVNEKVISSLMLDNFD